MTAKWEAQIRILICVGYMTLIAIAYTFLGICGLLIYGLLVHNR